MKLKKEPWNGHRIGVVGAGPAGITIAILMACRGYKVTIFEVREKIGGILRYGIPEFRLPKSILDRYYVKMKELDTVIVIGAGNAAMDVARTAIRKGSQHVTVYSITETPAASPKEVEYAMIDGVSFEYLQTALEIKDEGLIICDVEWTEEGKLVKHEETARFVPADSVIISISQGPQDRLVNRDKQLEVDDRGLLKTNEKGETTMEGIFASGDVVTGAKTVVEAVKYSKMIADAMDEYVKSKTLI